MPLARVALSWAGLVPKTVTPATSTSLHSALYWFPPGLPSKVTAVAPARSELTW